MQQSRKRNEGQGDITCVARLEFTAVQRRAKWIARAQGTVSWLRSCDRGAPNGPMARRPSFTAW